MQPYFQYLPSIREMTDSPRYRLAPHEADDLGVILLGHSIGGTLAAGVALLPSPVDSFQHSRKHRIMGLMNFDVPFLGLHPSVISSGIRSLFRKSDDSKGTVAKKSQGLEEMEDSYFPIVTNPNFDPSFGNDVRLLKSSRFLDTVQFFHKNMNHLPRSIFDSVMSYYKFPGYLNRLPHLRRQYKEMMRLEAADNGPNRVRFVNYYTEATGYKKSPTKRSSQAGGHNNDQKSKLEALAGDCQFPIQDELSSCASNDVAKSQPSKHEVKPDKRNPRTFVLKPSHHWKDGDDSLWEPVQMDNMDEVSAHQSIFLPGSNMYDRLVGEVVSTIQLWVQDSLSLNLLEMPGPEVSSS
ncbi:unnamed protein product [Penicillium olsonii]|nr:unnamed protein product [Penicillium olsonii]